LAASYVPCEVCKPPTKDSFEENHWLNFKRRTCMNMLDTRRFMPEEQGEGFQKERKRRNHGEKGNDSP
jgi:hypothetical protein